ncbi:RHE_PE00001 family protein [Pararhizobium haloflavum]|uniref:RHE_PE00001 family protein n=1 Tax=Pararhizobium haloflavum TaxID=2037914 RepID=UPI000C1A3E93|nr:RHE_PE00001 family protein [Pararhizobium haloflavum]
MVYHILDFDLQRLVLPLAQATAELARLDERVARSPVREGWLARNDFADAVAALWVMGDLVHLEDLVLHDQRMDNRAPSQELTRAAGVLRARRRIAGQPPDWALSAAGLAHLRNRSPVVPVRSADGEIPPAEGEGSGKSPRLDGADGALSAAIAAMDATLARSAATLVASSPDRRGRDTLVYDLDWNEDARLKDWCQIVAATTALPPVLRAALLIDVWREIEVLQHGGWLGPLLVAALLRQAGAVTAHLPALHCGLRAVEREKRTAKVRTERLGALLAAIAEMARLGMKEHDRLVLADTTMRRRLKGRRASSRLPQLIALVLAHPVVSAPMVEKALGVTQQGAHTLIAALGLREVTGRGRFRAWGIL